MIPDINAMYNKTGMHNSCQITLFQTSSLPTLSWLAHRKIVIARNDALPTYVICYCRSTSRFSYKCGNMCLGTWWYNSIALSVCLLSLLLLLLSYSCSLLIHHAIVADTVNHSHGVSDTVYTLLHASDSDIAACSSCAVAVQHRLYSQRAINAYTVAFEDVWLPTSFTVAQLSFM